MMSFLLVEKETELGSLLDVLVATAGVRATGPVFCCGVFF